LSPNEWGAIQILLGFNPPGNQAIATDALSIFYPALQPGSRIHRDQSTGMLVVEGRYFKMIVFVQFVTPRAAAIHLIFTSNADPRTVDSQPIIRKDPEICSDNSYNPDYPASV
jgi:hypothetical protein